MKILKKVVNFIKNNRLLIITLILSIYTINYLYYINQVTPYGKYSLLCVDFYHQYGPMMFELWQRLKSGSGLVYSFYQGLGLPFFRNFLNYLSSPFNILLFLFNKDGVLNALSLIIGIKSVASAGTMIYYLKEKFKTNSFLLIPIAIMYAFSAYYRAYYWNLMWIDGMVFLPLVILGIENIINKNKWKLYTFSLAIMLFANYFIGYMICIFSVIYFIIYFIYKFDFKSKNKKKNLKKSCGIVGTYALCSLLAGGLAAVALLPMASSMMSISATGSSMPTSQYYDFTVVDFLKAHLSCVDKVNFASDPINSPNISAGIISVFLFLSYISNLTIPKKNKICYTLLYLIVLSMFFSPQFDFIMHGMHVPNDLPYRYSFLYTFVVLVMGAYAILNLNKENYLKIVITFLFCIGIAVVCMFEEWEFITNNLLMINIIILCLFFLFYTLGRFFKVYEGIFFFALSLVTVIDSVESVNKAWSITQDGDDFISTTHTIDNTIDYIKKYDDSLFYRIDSTNRHTLNDSSISYYNGVTTFSSMAYESLAKLNNYLGTPGNTINSYEYIQQTPLYDLMFDVKYIMGSTIDAKRYESLDLDGDTKSVYKFKDTVGLAFGVSKDLKNWDYDNENPFDVQNEFVEKTSGITDLFEKLPVVSTSRTKESTMRVETVKYLNTGDNIYFNWNSSSISFVLIDNVLYYKDENYLKLNNTSYTTVIDYSDTDEIKNVISNDEYLNVTIGYNYYDENALNIYYINDNKFTDYYKKLLNNSMTITEYKENKISGKIYLDEDQIVYTSIPYDEGWTVYVDGKKVNTFKIGDALLGFETSKGQHSIKLEYNIPYLNLGLGISVTSLMVIIVLDNKDKIIYCLSKNIKRKTKKA